MVVLGNNWSDEARAASLEVRRAKARERAREAVIERKRREFFEANPGASEADWKRHDAEQLRAWRRERDKERWLKANPGKSDEDFDAHERARIREWRDKKEQEEKRLYGEQFEKQLSHSRSPGEFFVENWIPRGDDGTVYPSVIVDDETGEAVEVPPALREDFIEGWIDDDRPVTVADPHWGRSAPDAPYGYHDRTGEPRTEPLYDVNGWPVIPMMPRPHFRTRAEWKAAEAEWRQRSIEAREKWGRWGRGW